VAASVGVALYTLADDSDLDNALSHTMVPFVVGLFAHGVSRLMSANEELTAAREELAGLAVTNERLRFARDLHDLLGHSLTVIRAKSELASRVARDDPDRAACEMESVEHLSRQALVDMREAVTGYRHLTLAAEVANGRAVLRAAGITPDVAVNGVALASDVDETLGWVVREAITNVVRHSQASRCRVATVVADGEVRLEVADDGRGGAPADGMGLTGVRERLAAVGGTLDVHTSPEAGFRVVARVPVSG
jgi:two-component system sensor histidine kinase DesK